MPAVFCFIAAVVFAQSDYTIKNINTENGLPLNEVTAMTMGSDGYLWVGTRNGLVRYDGSDVKIFSFEQDHNIGNTTVNYVIDAIHTLSDRKTIIKTRAGRFYLIENGRPVSCFDTTYFNEGWEMFQGSFPSLAVFNKFFLKSKGKASQPGWTGLYKKVLPVDENTFILGSSASSGIIYLKDGIRWRAIETGIKLDQLLPSSGSYFIADNSQEMHLYDRATDRFRKINIDPGLLKKADIPPGHLLFFSDSFSNESFCFYNGTFYLLQFDAGSNTMKFLPQFSIKDKGHFWTGVVYDKLNSTFFLSTQNEGFFQVKLKKIKTFNINEMLPNSALNSATIYAVLKISDSTVIIPSGFQFTSGSSGISAKKLGNVTGERETISLVDKKSILTTDGGSINAYSPDDGYRARKAYNDAYNKRSKLSKVELIYPEGDSIWVACDNQFHYITKNKFTLLYDIERDKSWKYFGLRLFYRINNNEAFIANDSNLYRLKTSYPYSTAIIPEMTGKQVRHISPYKDMLILSVYRNGVYVMKNDQFYKVPVMPDQPELSSCHSTYLDKNGFIWIPTDKGLYKSTVASLVESALTPGSNYPFFFSYGKADGIDNIEFNGRGMPTYAVLDNGQAFYPSMGGVVTFNLNELADSIASSPVIIEKIVIDNKETSQVSDSIYLNASFKYLTIDLSIANFSDPQNLFLEYNIDSKGWKKVLANDRQRITLVDISSGKHQLVIRKRTGFGNEDYVYKTITIIRQKGIYEKVWFYIVLAGVFGFLIWLFLHLKTRNIKRKKATLQKRVDEQTIELSKEMEVKDLLISIISHDMMSPQRHVAIVAKSLRMGLEKDSQKINEALSDIQTTSERILAGSATVINWMKYNSKKIGISVQAIHVRDLVNEALDIYIPIAKSKNIVFVNDVPKSTAINADYNILHTIFTNIISNAVKYTDEGTIRIFAEETGGRKTIVLKIADTGRGISEQRLDMVREVLKGNLQVLKSTDRSSGLGYLMISELQKIHNLSVSIESKMGKGTIVSITMNPGNA